MKIEIYKSGLKAEWDGFVRNSKNGTFLFYRDFIEYHGDRFGDYSLMFYDGGSLLPDAWSYQGSHLLLSSGTDLRRAYYG